jgi:nucleoid-associated protein YgaU
MGATESTPPGANPGVGNGTNNDSFGGASPGGNDLVITWPASDNFLDSPLELPEREVASFDWNAASTEAPFTGGTSSDLAEGARQPASTSTTLIANAPATIRDPIGSDTYIVQKGDSFWSIAESWYGDGSKMDLIVKANPSVSPQRLQIGQRLVLPPRDTARANQGAAANNSGAPRSSSQPVPPLADVAGTHTVREGDTLVKIARLVLQERWEVGGDLRRQPHPHRGRSRQAQSGHEADDPKVISHASNHSHGASAVLARM